MYTYPVTSRWELSDHSQKFRRQLGVAGIKNECRQSHIARIKRLARASPNHSISFFQTAIQSSFGEHTDAPKNRLWILRRQTAERERFTILLLTAAFQSRLTHDFIATIINTKNSLSRERTVLTTVERTQARRKPGLLWFCNGLIEFSSKRPPARYFLKLVQPRRNMTTRK